MCAAHLSHTPRPVLQADIDSRILIAGQAPGARVHQSGQPFTDPSGDRLRNWMGVDHTTFYDATKIAIVPMGFCYPGTAPNGGDHPPRPECAPKWRQTVLDHMPNIQLTLLVGMYAQQWHLGRTRKRTLTQTVQSFAEYGPNVMPLPHPSWRNTTWIKKNPWFADTLLPQLKTRIRQVLTDCH